MAEGAWVPLFDSLWTDPKTARLAAELHTSVDVAAAKFMRVCAWARDHAESGDLVGVTDEQLATIAAVTVSSDRPADRARKGARLREALVASGFLKGERLHIAGWEDGPGRLVANRARERERIAERRRRDREIEGRASSAVDQVSGVHGPGVRRTPTDPAGEPRGADAASLRRPRGASAAPLRHGRATSGAGPENAHRGDRAQSDELPAVVRRTPDLRTPDTDQVSAGTESTQHNTTTPPPPADERPIGRGGADAGREDDVAAEVVRSADQPLRDVLGRILEAGTSRTNLATWFLGAELRERAPGEYQLRVANAFARDWVTTHYQAALLGALRATTGKQRISLDVTTVGREPDVVEPSS